MAQNEEELARMHEEAKARQKELMAQYVEADKKRDEQARAVAHEKAQKKLEEVAAEIRKFQEAKARANKTS